MKRHFGRILMVLATMTLESTMWADPLIPGLFNTGVDNNGVVFAIATTDLHYTVTASWLLPNTGTPAGPFVVTTQPSGWPVGAPWEPANTSSAWVRPTAGPAIPGDPPQGVGASILYDYAITINLTLAQVTNGISIRGKWATDNNGVDILVNSTSLGYTTPNEYFRFSDFTLNRGFIAGDNTIHFQVRNIDQNGGNPAGFRAEFTSVPEGAESLCLLLMSGALLLLATRRKALLRL